MFVLSCWKFHFTQLDSLHLFFNSYWIGNSVANWKILTPFPPSPTFSESQLILNSNCHFFLVASVSHGFLRLLVTLTMPWNWATRHQWSSCVDVSLTFGARGSCPKMRFWILWCGPCNWLISTVVCLMLLCWKAKKKGNFDFQRLISLRWGVQRSAQGQGEGVGWFGFFPLLALFLGFLVEFAKLFLSWV